MRNIFILEIILCIYFS